MWGHSCGGRDEVEVADTRWLEQRGLAWYAVQDVPRPMREALGRKRLIVSLQTRELRIAQARRHDALSEFARQIAAARACRPGTAVLDAGMRWRGLLATDSSDEQCQAAGLEYDRIEYQHGRTAAAVFAEVSLGRATPLLHSVDAWLAEGGVKGPLKERTRSQYRADLVRLGDWLGSKGLPATLEAVTPSVAGRFVTEELIGKGVDWGTGNRRISAASAYWRWLIKRAGLTTNPWSGQSLARSAQARVAAKTKRAFTTGEVAMLLAGPADAELADAMRLAALTGARIEELYRLQVGDCRNGWLDIRVSKTRAGQRRIPVHADLEPIIARRSAGKAIADYIFHEPKSKDGNRERSSAMSKRFGRYRQSLEVEERDDGRRHSRIDFHSWRRWFVTEARRAGIDRAVVAAVVGHRVGNLTDDVYADGPDAALLRRCVEAVRLPSSSPEPPT